MTVQKYNSKYKSLVFTLSTANKEKALNVIFFTCVQFRISFKEARMNVSILNILEKWYELVEYAKNTLFFCRSLASSQMA